MKKRPECVKNLSLTSLIAVTLVGCSASGASEGASESQGSKNEDAETIEFTVMGPMIGGTVGLGQQQEHGAHLAIQKVNENDGTNGKKLVYDVCDDQMNTNRAVICVEEMAIANKYRFMVTPTSTGCFKAAYPTWTNAGLPVLSGIDTGNTITELGYKNYLRICAKDSAIIEQICGHMVNKCGVRKPAILYTSVDTNITNFDFTKNYPKDKCNIDIIDSAQIQVETEKDYTAYTTNLRGRGTDAVCLLTEYNPTGLSLKQKASPSWDVQVLGNTSCANPLILQMTDVECTEGFITTSTPDAENTNERVRKSVRSYTELTDVDPGREAAGPYDLIYMVSEALRNEEINGLDGSTLVKRLRFSVSYPGIMVDVEGSDADGDNPNAKPHMLVAKNGIYVGIDGKQKEIEGRRQREKYNVKAITGHSSLD